MKRLLAVLAVAVGLSLPLATPASADYGNKALSISVGPSNEGLVLLNAYVYGLAFGAWVTCAEMGTGPNPAQFGDCNWMLNNEWSYSCPIFEWWSHFGHSVTFWWNVPYNQYMGYTVS
jgi:hypothetical protein